ncbi:MAG: BLUF domain-containing protein [Oceanicaulis sp.]
MGLHQIIYSSRPFGFDAGTLNAILMDARRANDRDGVTGALICREDIYIQLLEGPDAAVKAAVARIGRDDRHVDLTLHVDTAIEHRLFGEWAMLHDPAVSWLWSPEEIAAGAVERASADDMRAIFVKLRARQERPGAV